MELNYEIEEKIDKLFSAVYEKDIETACELIEEGVNPNATCSNAKSGSASILYSAVRSNQKEVVQRLLIHGANPNITDEEGDTPLFAAVYKDIDPEIQNLLIKHGANTNHRNKAGNTVLMHLAIHSSDFENECTEDTLFSLLKSYEDLSQRNSRDQTLMHLIPFVHGCTKRSIERNEHICLKYLKHLTLNGGMINEPDGNSWTPLHHACSAGCFDAVSFLLHHGANVNARSIAKQSVIHTLGMKSNQSNFQRTLDLLLKYGCSIEDTESLDRSILHYVSSSNAVNRQAIDVVLRYGLTASKVDAFGLSPLHLCVMPSVFISCDQVEHNEELKNDVSEVVETLVKNNADVNSVDRNMLTPLHYALRYSEKVETVKTLLKNGSSVNQQTKTGETALHRATLYSNLFEALIEFIDTNLFDDFNYNIQDNFGSTALHWAIYYFEPICVKMLILRGADTTIADADGRTPRQLAISLRRTQLFEDLGIYDCQETFPLPYKFVLDDGTFEEREEEQETKEGTEESKDCINASGMECEGCQTSVHSSRSNIFQSEASFHNTGNNSKMSDGSNDVEKEIDDSVSGESEDGLSEQCMGVDHVWVDCPVIKEVIFENNHVDLDSWSGHLVYHRHSITTYIKAIVGSKQMGLYQELSENDIIATKIHKVLEYLSDDIKMKYPLFEFSLSIAGSWSEGTKVGCPDEFDYKLILKRFSTAYFPQEDAENDPTGYVRFVLKKEYVHTELREFVNEHGFLDSRKVIRVLYAQINRCLSQLPEHLCEGLYPVKYLKPEKSSIDHLSFRWVGCSYKNLLIDVDMVPTIIPANWQPSCINRDRHLLKRVANLPYSVVMKTPDSRFVRDWFCLFRISVADKEVEIFRSLPKSILKGYTLMKSLKSSPYFPKIFLQEDDRLIQTCLTTYHMKTCFLHEVESMRFSNFVKRNNSDEQTSITVAYRLLNRLSKIILNEGYLESYFVMGVNVLAYESLFRMNHSAFFECEIDCLKTILDVGANKLVDLTKILQNII